MIRAFWEDSFVLAVLHRQGRTASSSPNSSAASLPYGRDPGSSPSYVPRTSVSSVSGSSPSSLRQIASDSRDGANRQFDRARTAPRPPAAGQFGDHQRGSRPDEIALGRSNDGSQFGMFMQVFADGTVVDSEGVHHVGPADLRPIVDAVQSGDVYRTQRTLRAPATDFIEYVQIVVFERRLGRLMAHSFSYSGNPQGCDHAIRHIHTALENLQSKLSRQPAANAPSVAAPPIPSGNSPVAHPWPSNPAGNSPAPVLSPQTDPQPISSATNPAATVPAGPVIPLTPIDSPR